MYNTDPNRRTEDILTDIKIGAVQSFSPGPMGGGSNLGAVLAPLAALMVKLSRDAEAGAQRMERLTKRLYVLTVLILVLTLLLLIREIAKDAFEFYEKQRAQHQSEQQPKQNPSVDKEQKSAEPAGRIDPATNGLATIIAAEKKKKQ